MRGASTVLENSFLLCFILSLNRYCFYYIVNNKELFFLYYKKEAVNLIDIVQHIAFHFSKIKEKNLIYKWILVL